MSFKKRATLVFDKIQPLNSPKNWEIFNLPPKIKTAATKIILDEEDLGDFDLKQATTDHPDHLYVKIFAIKKDEPNDNADAFSESELKKAAETFIGVPLFTNHQNDDVEKARGECIHSWYSEKDGGIYIIGKVDKVAYPKLARGIEEKYIKGCSMGCFQGHNRVLMADGSYERIDEVNEGDEVITHKGNVKKIKNLQIHEDKTNDTIYNIKVEGLPNKISATKEHPFYVLKEQEYCSITGDYIGSPKSYNRFRKRMKSGAYQMESYEVAVKEGKLDGFDFEWKETKNLNKGDMLCFPISKKIIEDEEATIDKARLIGYFLAEGSYLKYKGEKTAVEFNFSLSKEKDTLGREVIGLLRKVFDGRNEPRIQERPNRDILMIRLYGRDVAQWFYKYCGEYSHEKELYKDCLYWHPNIQKHILATWINGDGTCRNIYHRNGKLYQNITSTTCSETLHYQMKFIASRLSIYSTTDYVGDRATKRGKKPYWTLVFGSKESQKLNEVIEKSKIVNGKYSDSWFRIADDYLVMPIKSIEEEYNTEPVYNIEVEDDHSYIVEGVAVRNCSVEYSICSVCHNRAATADQYCTHVKENKNRKYSGKMECKYHKSKTEKDETCPLCGSTKKEAKTLNHDNQKVYEHNYGIRFIENSFVVNPACHDCGVRCVLHVPEVQKKVASLSKAVDNLIKYSSDPEFVEKNIDKLEKIGGVKELESLKDSMNEMETVVQSMLKQKENVSMQYVSDLVKAMADVQGIFDELNEMGYGALPSPAITSDMGTDGITEGVTEPFPAPVPPPAQPVMESGNSTREDLGGLGSMTKPKTSNKKIKDFPAENSNLLKKVSSLRDILYRYASEGADKVTEVIAEVISDNKESSLDRIIIVKDNDDYYITEAKGNDVKNLSNVNHYSKEIRELVSTDPVKAGETILNSILSKEIGADMTITNNENTVKTAADAGKTDVIQEKQLETIEESKLHPRAKTPEQITEGPDQLGGGEVKNVTTSDTPGIRTDNINDTIIEDNLDAGGKSILRFGDAPDVITEKQWDEMSRLVSAKLSEDYTSAITESQLADLLSSHKFTGNINIITEKQIEGMTLGISRWANNDYNLSLIKIATKAIADAVAIFGKSPKELIRVASLVSDDDSLKRKVSFLSVMNSLPYKEESRKQLEENLSYFKTASQDKVSTIDALILSIAANADFGVKAEDAFDFVVQSLQNKKTMAKVQELIKIKESKVSNKIVTKADAFESVLKAVEKPEDGKYRIKATVKEIGVPTTDKVAFCAAVTKFAQEIIDDESVNTVVIKITPDSNGGLVIDIEDGASEEDAFGPDDIEGLVIEEVSDEVPEVEGLEEEGLGEEGLEETESCGTMAKDTRDKIVKEAQLMGGEMGGQGGMGQGPGAGATVPGAPGTEPAPLETFTDEGDIGDMEGVGDEDLEPLPPGSVCPVCGSKDVDVISGQGKCNNCGSKMSYKVEVNVTDWKGTTPSEEDVVKGEEPVEEEFGGEGFEMPEEAPAIAAYTKLSPDTIKKIAEQKIMIGTISPATGSSNTIDIGEGNHICLDTGIKYKVSYVTNKEASSVWGQWTWVPKVAGVDCPSCSRAKKKFVEALSTVDITEEKFDAMNIDEKIKIIASLREKGALKEIKTASKEGSIIADYKTAFGDYGDSFPLETCIEKISRRYGENALALSGPCEGKPLADCVCNRLKSAGVYTTGLSMKVASAWSDVDGDEECVTDQVRNGYTLRQAAAICGTLKVVVAQPEDLFTDEISDDFGEEEIPVEEEGAIEEVTEDVDPFDGVDGGTITIEIPKDVAQQLEDKLDAAIGGDEGEEVIEGPIEDVVEEGPIGEDVVEEGPIGEESVEDIGETKDMTDVPGDEGCVFEEENGGETGGGVEIRVNGEPVNQEPALAEDEGMSLREAAAMKGGVGKVGKPQMDLSKVASIVKEAGEKEITQQNAQDSPDIGSYSAGENGSQMGHESETVPSAAKPSVPRDNATIGEEDTDLNPQDKPQPVIPSDKATMGHEEEVGLEGGDNRYTGGDQGAGKTQTASADEDLYHMRGFGSSKDGLNSLADRILNAGNKKEAQSTKKLEAPKPVADDEDIKPIKGDSTIGDEPKFTADTPTNIKGQGNASEMGHETETLGDRPDSPKDHPDVATGDAQMGKEDLDSEKTTRDKGTVIADSDTESEAIRVAGRMLETGKINTGELQQKIGELKSYQPAQIRDLEKAIFAGEKGLDTGSEDGMSQAVVINETSNVRGSQADLSEKLAGLFSLEQRNREADGDSDIQLRKTYRK